MITVNDLIRMDNYDREMENVKPIELCRKMQKRTTRKGSAKRNYYGELRRFRGYRGPQA